jgi:hypothetical protein
VKTLILLFVANTILNDVPDGRVARLVELVSVIEQSALTKALREGRENTKPFGDAFEPLNRWVDLCGGFCV